MVFAYGSGVLPQIGHPTTQSKMMDFIFVVTDPLEWHRENMRRNARHYSSLRFLGPATVTNVQCNWGAKIYFNTLVPTHEGLIKYGVISERDLICDLLDWDTLYVAGRLHKPVNMLLKGAADSELAKAWQLNLNCAVRTALLLLPEAFSEEELYETIASLSYSGDFRMRVGEDKNKVSNIVGAQMPEFRALYKPVLAGLNEYLVLNANNHGHALQDTSPHAKYRHLSLLPMQLQRALVQECNKDGRSRDVEEVLLVAAQDPDTGDMVLKGVRSIVARSSVTQSLKGILTAGLWKSIRYSSAKVKKMISSWHR
ncbi:Phosphatidate cytidylyltransferase mitochondrial [Trinorchestia longiramus]|nr:Phosphatidate cytidylyltransferase mitochondrial [Trinorchestia longiramus]